MKDTMISKDFIFGAVSGIALMAIIILGYLVLAGAAPSEKGTTVNNKVAANNPTQPTNNQPAQPTNVDIEVTEDDHIRGPKDAEITIVEFSDFQCPFCNRFHDTMKQVLAENDNVRWVYKHFPLDSIHPLARKAAEASECAADQDKFWEYTDELFARQDTMSDATFESIASDLGLNIGTFSNCLDSGTYADKVESEYQLGLQSGVRGTPGNFINGQAVPGAVPYSQIQGIIDSLQ